jgi:hypothetical protein
MWELHRPSFILRRLKETAKLAHTLSVKLALKPDRKEERVTCVLDLRSFLSLANRLFLGHSLPKRDELIVNKKTSRDSLGYSS